jgi:hypothetical protein
MAGSLNDRSRHSSSVVDRVDPVRVRARPLRDEDSLPAPGWLAFLFIGLVGSSAERSVRALQRRVAALELRNR